MSSSDTRPSITQSAPNALNSDIRRASDNALVITILCITDGGSMSPVERVMAMFQRKVDEILKTHFPDSIYQREDWETLRKLEATSKRILEQRVSRDFMYASVSGDFLHASVEIAHAYDACLLELREEHLALKVRLARERAEKVERARQYGASFQDIRALGLGDRPLNPLAESFEPMFDPTNPLAIKVAVEILDNEFVDKARSHVHSWIEHIGGTAIGQEELRRSRSDTSFTREIPSENDEGRDSQCGNSQTKGADLEEIHGEDTHRKDVQRDNPRITEIDIEYQDTGSRSVVRSVLYKIVHRNQKERYGDLFGWYFRLRK